ncbi:MAG: hypothetical protein HOP14_03085 [Acidobacteria bacterium]|nr:hypothetical protein [Acidobacteriota bacterium]
MRHVTGNGGTTARSVSTALRVLGVVAMLLGTGLPADAQVDLSGTWASRNHEDWMERWPGPDVGDFSGLPINDDAKTRALSYSPSLLSLPERQCLYYGPTYTVIGPFGLKLWSESDPVDGQVVAWKMSGAVDKSPRTIWMDGRPRPSDTAKHTFEGFSTGRWDGETLIVTTTHMKAGPLRRNGVPSSDQAVMTEYFNRYGSLLTVLAIIEDPAYLEEPHVVSRTWELDPTLNMNVYPAPCTPGIEAPGLDAGAVPHYLPGQNPFVNEMSRYGLPTEATMGGAHTLYPEFRKVLQPQYSRPESCGRYCCGWNGGNTGAAGFGDASGLVCTTREPPRR